MLYRLMQEEKPANKKKGPVGEPAENVPSFHRYSCKSKVEDPFCTDFYADIGILPLFQMDSSKNQGLTVLFSLIFCMKERIDPLYVHDENTDSCLQCHSM